MNIFDTHETIIADYESYIRSFIKVRDERIANEVNIKLNDGTLFPKPLIQFNPSFRFGDKLSNLCDGNFLHQDISKIFAGYDLYKHQVEALKLGTAGKDFIVTSGTGSGKSLTYIGTIFDRILRQSPKKKGIKAIIVYPMNALINSQTQEFEKYRETYLKGLLPKTFDHESLTGLNVNEATRVMETAIGRSFPITFKQYTGQEGREARENIKQNPPDILMTNYMMLELIMTRLGEAPLRAAMQESLEFLVFDELHTYRGRQGADVAMLIRRIRAYAAQGARPRVQDLGAKEQSRTSVQCIGTSATMSSGGDDLRAQKEEVANVGKLIFGKEFTAEQVINESLTRVTGRTEEIPSSEELRIAIEQGVPTSGSEQALKFHPLSIWLENAIGLEEIKGATPNDNWLRRRKPITFARVVTNLQAASRKDLASCDLALKNLLEWAEVINEELREQGSRKAYFPFRLHQFISQTGSVYLSLEDKGSRQIRLEAGQFIKTDKYDKLPIYQAVFSRITGHEFICVRKNYDEGRLETRGFNDIFEEDTDSHKIAGYLIPQPEGEEDLWRDDMIESLPDAWYKHYKNGNTAVIPKYRDRIPTRIWYQADGSFSDNPDAGFSTGRWAWFMPAKLLFDPTAGVFYDAKSSEGTKLMRLGNEGRSTATTTLSLATIKALSEAEIPIKEQKLLSFTDNRQDASLQSGHYNDFVSIGRIRSAIQFALKDAPNEELTIDRIAEEVFKKLGIDQREYAQKQAEFTGQIRENEDTLKDFLTIRILQDLKRGWRYTMPNLEQCALLVINYKYLAEEAATDKHWAEIPILNQLEPAGREEFLIQTLDYIRTSNAIYHRFFFDESRPLIARIKDKLKNDWTLGRNEKLEAPNYVRPESIGRVRTRNVHTASIGKMSNWGKYVAGIGRTLDVSFTTESFAEFAHQLLGLLTRMGLLRDMEIEGDNGRRTTGYILDAGAIVWKRGDLQTVRRDKVRLRTMGEDYDIEPNKYFQDFYLQDFRAMKPLLGHEHTGQIPHQQRVEREAQFREGEITTLFCSPTMELGVDISNLNVVHMRNVPPNPANYAQRSGRAGRSGQGALVMTYCSQLSAHDQHYFKNAADMVDGKVVAPRINISNEDLLKSHIQATYMLEAGIDLRSSLTEIVDLSDEKLRLREEVRNRLRDGHEQRCERVGKLFNHILASDTSLRDTLTPEVLAAYIAGTPESLDAAMNRWRELYRNAVAMRDEARVIIDNPIYTRNSDEKQQAARNERFAKNQIDSLRNEGDTYSFSEFYPFRYLASEGFLPGYNFTRLPLRTALESGETAQFLSRPRLLALREYGPRNIIYHNGQSYQIDRLNTTDIEAKRENAKVATASGYLMMGAELKRETCPITGANLNNGGGDTLYRLIEMGETSAKPLQRISCEEEERRKNGYEIGTYFSLPHGLAGCDTLQVKSGAETLLDIYYMPTATITQVNKKLRRSTAEQFYIDKNYGYWATAAQQAKDEEGRIIPISLYASIVTNALYIQPTKKLGTDENGIITLQYALKRALEESYQVESNEIGVVLMGEGKLANIMVYEASEGSLGILSQLVRDKEEFQRLIERAYEICYFADGQDTEPDLGPATYNDLLSYYNQRYHEDIDRHLIKPVLENLMTCTIVINNRGQVGDYDEHYKHLLDTYDKSSSTELRFLEYLYKRGLRLPDKAQPKLSDDYGLYIMPDFQYDKHVFVFCDGTPHDTEETRRDDRKKRRAMKSKGLRAIIYHYQDDLDKIAEENADIFIPVK